MNENAELAPAPRRSVWERTAAVFIRPREVGPHILAQPTALFPLLLSTVFLIVGTWLLYKPGIVPMQLKAMEERVASGEMPADALERAESMMSSTPVIIVSVCVQAVLAIVLQLLVAGAMLLVLNFILGGKATFRTAWSLAWWSNLIWLVPLLISVPIVLASGRFPIHFGLGILAPPEDSTTKMGFFLGALLDTLSPFTAWHAAVLSLGGAAISGKPVKTVTTAVIVTYIVVAVFLGGLGAFARGLGG